MSEIWTVTTLDSAEEAERASAELAEFHIPHTISEDDTGAFAIAVPKEYGESATQCLIDMDTRSKALNSAPGTPVTCPECGSFEVDPPRATAMYAIAIGGGASIVIAWLVHPLVVGIYFVVSMPAILWYARNHGRHICRHCKWRFAL